MMGLSFSILATRTPTHGVAILISKEKAKTLLEWEPVSKRLIRVCLNSKYCKLTILQCYAPTNKAEEEVKEDWNEQLPMVVSKVPQHDVLLLTDDMNAKVGTDNSNNERAMGRHGCSKRNNNALRISA
jgi:exonuclease III